MAGWLGLVSQDCRPAGFGWRVHGLFLCHGRDGRAKSGLGQWGGDVESGEAGLNWELQIWDFRGAEWPRSHERGYGDARHGRKSGGLGRG